KKMSTFNAFRELNHLRWVTFTQIVTNAVNAARQDGFSMNYWPEAIANLDEFAALVSALDLVVTVCNTTVHYAGAVGTAAWILAPTVPEWRYGLSNRSLPWYPSSVMYRQARAGDWSSVIDSICHDLRERYPAQVI
ncbi:MAG: hypothetical protein ACKOF9_03505, partial [Burkholderiales bacterium]